ncbi:hypothetical protein BKA83DRAFT_4128163 [Pisolithus microcarpus]|nr:hypothetical protein BKA83DRAFT_4128163 [Pisolithus microcarpus]
MAFGVTVENMQMIMLMSEPFNFITESEHLIYFFCSLAFGNEHELRWDPTIQRVTHVFEAWLISEDGKPVNNLEPILLKDSWRDHDWEHEDVILDQIFADLWIKQGIAKEAEARKCFLTILAVGNVMVNRKINNTDNLLQCPDLPADYTLYQLPVNKVPKLQQPRTGEGLTPVFSWVPPATKIHSHVVFKEICKPIPLQFMHSVGWVHGDISTSNVLCAAQTGKLADIKYAKHMDSKKSHEVCTGTLEFIACTVLCMAWSHHGGLQSSFQPVALHMTKVNKHLCKAYVASEATLLPNYHDALEDLHSIVTKCVILFHPGAK